MQTLFDPHILLTNTLAGLHCGVSVINLSPLPLCTSCEGLEDLLSKSKKKCAALWSMSLVSTLMRLPMPANLKIKMATSFSSNKKNLGRGLGFGKGWLAHNYQQVQVYLLLALKIWINKSTFGSEFIALVPLFHISKKLHKAKLEKRLIFTCNFQYLHLINFYATVTPLKRL